MTPSELHTRKTKWRLLPVAGSKVRSWAVDTFVTWTRPRASASSAIAIERSLEFEPTMARAPASAARAAASRASRK